MAGNDDHPDCGWTPFNKIMKEHWKRAFWDITHFFKRENNPYDDKGPREGYKNLAHSLTNIPVEYARSCPHRAGHYFLATNILWVTIIVILLIRG